ncbi:FAD-binding protein [Thermogymnomonas acidicola]|uniref:FAD-binding protein n=1 Tax=Thermogymnomonas acidicola TaxID=399579 RepID=UPI00094674BE|nr:FAD-binding protein [Thermogymnomonas acidicola]
MERVVVIGGGGNAGLCAAIESAERGGSEVILIEASPEALRGGGNSKYTRDIRYAHGEDRFTSGEYPRRELLEDLRKVSGSSFSSSLAEMVVERSELIPEWMHRHGVRFKREIRGGTLDLNRTNAFFMGGGKFLVDTYYSYLSKLKVRVLYETQVVSVGIRGGNRITHVGGATVPRWQCKY